MNVLWSRLITNAPIYGIINVFLPFATLKHKIAFLRYLELFGSSQLKLREKFWYSFMVISKIPYSYAGFACLSLLSKLIEQCYINLSVRFVCVNSHSKESLKEKCSYSVYTRWFILKNNSHIWNIVWSCKKSDKDNISLYFFFTKKMFKDIKNYVLCNLKFAA